VCNACDDVCYWDIEEETDLLRPRAGGGEPHRREHTCAVDGSQRKGSSAECRVGGGEDIAHTDRCSSNRPTATDRVRECARDVALQRAARAGGEGALGERAASPPTPSAT
jgi:hypothetical protein